MTWNWNPLIALSLFLPTWAYMHGVMHLWRQGSVGRGVSRWQVGAFLLGMVTIFIALISPIDPLGEQLLSMHMVQHVLLMLIAPPLLVLGTPPTIFLWVFSVHVRRVIGQWFAPQTQLHQIWRQLSTPLTAWVVHGTALWVWHMPYLYQAALLDPGLHMLEHASFLGTAILFWRAALVQAPHRSFVGIGLIFTTALHSSILGALMTFGTVVWYPLYTTHALQWNTTALENQQLAGLVMWIPGGIVYVIAVLALLGWELKRMEKSGQLTHNHFQ